MRLCTIFSHIFPGLIFIYVSTFDAISQPNQLKPAGESYQNFTHDGAWCWFSDPRAVYYENDRKVTYAGWVNRAGDIVVGAYDHVAGTMDTAILHQKLQADDHANPSLLVRHDGRLMVFYSKHSERNSPLFLRVSRNPEDISEWQPEQQLWLNDNPAYPSDYRRDFCYTNPYQLNAENNKIFLFWRGIGFKPCVSTSKDGGKTWEPGRILIMPGETYKDRRPYVKYDSNGKDKILIAFTDGHPRDEPTNSIYYACYRGGALYKANGQKIANWNELPIKPNQADVVYDATKTKVRAWIWDVAENEKGYPIIVYVRLPAENDHRYHYARWEGKKWQDYQLCQAGKWFPKTPEGEKEPEQYYSGGIFLDHNDPSIVYLSRPINGVFEIEKWTTKNNGKSWQIEAITSGSMNDNVRPFVVNNHAAGELLRVLWMSNRQYFSYTQYDAAIKMDIPLERLSPALESNAIVQAMKRVADWQLDHPSPHELTDWTHGALFTGLTAWALMADEDKYLDALRNFAEQNDWQLGNRRYHADDHCVGSTYLELYGKYRDPKMIQPLQGRFDYILQHPSPVTLKSGEQKELDRWWWCDALFMSPPVWTELAMITGDRKYLDFMNSEWWQTTDYLYDRDEHLFYRDDRYFDQQEANGKKIFWSRGNGWVIAGLARVLQNMPADYADRPRYIQLFKQMAAKLAEIQPQDGLWRSSLLDPDNYPNQETSGSGFFCFALAWGINQGILDKSTYFPVVKKAWTGLVKSIHLDGKLGYVQPIGADPRHVSADQTEIYGVGAFLLAGSEVYKLALFDRGSRAIINVINPITMFRQQETVSLDWIRLTKLLPEIMPEKVTVFYPKENRFLVTQVLKDERNVPEELLFQSDWVPNETRTFWIAPEQDDFKIPEPKTRTFAMYVPQRKEDFAWENDRVAFRMYGKALEDETVSSGVDVWVKSVRYPVIEKWYKLDDYHVDHGEGLDFYKVGQSRGCGGLAIWKNGQLFASRNYRQWKIIASGPIRTTFELKYEPWQAGKMTVSEVKRISMDLGSNLNRFESYFKTDDQSQQLDIAMGIVKVQNDGEMIYNLAQGWMGYWPPADSTNGVIGCGLVVDSKDSLRFMDQYGHGFLITPITSDKPLVYYAGAGWNKSGDFPDRESWISYLERFARKAANPLKVDVSITVR